MTDALTFATRLALQTGRLLLEHHSLTGTQASLKKDHTLVTTADLTADRLISQTIRECFPNDELLSEELQPEYKSHASGSPEKKLTAFRLEKAVWVIDPLDGTTNFSLGLHYWGVSIARLEDGLPKVAALCFPLLDELYTAQRGQGAYLNGDRIRVRPPDKDHPASFFSCCSRTHKRYDVKVRYKTRILGSATYDLCSVARGTAVLGFQATPKIWDIAGAWLMVEEAGGVVETHDSSEPFPLMVLQDYNQQAYPTLAAANQEVLAKGREWIQPK
jgi:myo-inositol-1(or 4)-monophosphatase